jgi:hypothetical protein
VRVQEAVKIVVQTPEGCEECPYSLLCLAGDIHLHKDTSFFRCDLCDGLWVEAKPVKRMLRCSYEMRRRWRNIGATPWVCYDCVWEIKEERRKEEEEEMRKGINDEERRQWVDNDEGLYSLWQESGIGQYRWVKENRAIIDEVIVNVRDGKKPAHYLKYGGQRG